MADVTDFGIPLQSGLVSTHETTTDSFRIGRTASKGVITNVTCSFQKTQGPTNGPLRFRVGTSLDGVAGVDYVEFSINSGAINFSQVASLAIPADTNVNFRIVPSTQDTARDMYGSVQFTSSPIGVGVSGGALYTTVDEVKNAMNIPLTDPEQDESIELDIDAVSRLMDSLVPQTFVQQTLNEKYDGSCVANGVVLNSFPSELLSDRQGIAVKEDGVTLVFDEEWEIPPYPSRVLYRKNGTDDVSQARFATGERNIEVTYATAYFALPGSVAMMCRREVQYIRLGHSRNKSPAFSNLGVSTRTEESGAAITWTADELSSRMKLFLSAYQNGRWPAT